MSSKKSREIPERKVALCYVRLSYTRDDDDRNSPERQRANIEAFLKSKGWIAEWYEDVGGHKSARKEENRPEWMRLKARLGDPDVVALVANDLSRLHRKGWRVGDLVDYLEKHEMALALAAPGREVDTSTALGRLFIQFTAIIDEYYSEDISQRAKDSVSYRKARGISIGMPPFGTFRADDSYLRPSIEGAWLLADGTFVAGTEDTPPEEGAVWRGYYDAAHYTLTLYATGNLGLEKIAYRLNEEGWAYRDRTGQPRTIERDDIRRVVANWPEYGGLVQDRSAKRRPAYENYQNVDEIPFKDDRAVFPIELLRAVAQARLERTVRRLDEGVNTQTHFYPLSGITYCAHCARLAAEKNDPRLISALGGSSNYGKLRYRHKAGVKCGCHNRSVQTDILEADFGRLIKLLTVRPEVLDLMTELAIQMDKTNGGHTDQDLEQEKQEAIAICRRRIDAAVVLFGDGMISVEEYRRRVEQNEREITFWQTRTTETEKLALELAICAEALDKLSRLWDISDDEDRQGLVRSLFTEVVYDLDTQRIVDFKLKPWADRFVILRAALYEDDDDEGEGEGIPSGGGDDDDNGGSGAPLGGGNEDMDETQAALSIDEAACEAKSPMGHLRMQVLRACIFFFFSLNFLITRVIVGD